jgi:phage-related protein
VYRWGVECLQRTGTDALRHAHCLTPVVKYDNNNEAIAKPLHGLGWGEIALPFVGDAYRVIYALQLGEDVWVVHAFQKKATQGIKTPKHELDLIADRIKRLKGALS